MDKFVVPRLEDLAYVASFKDLVSKINSFRDYRPGEKRPAQVLESNNSVAISQPTSQDGINAIRNRLSDHLFGKMSVKVRDQYMDCFFRNRHKLCKKIKVWMFLDCVLDEHFQSLMVHVAFPCSEPDVNLIRTVANRSSGLKTLEIHLGSLWMYPVIDKLNSVISSLSLLKNLTSLTLSKLSLSNRSILKLLGKSCPFLTSLRVSGFMFDKQDILAVILGELVDVVFPHSQEEYQDEEAALFEDRTLQSTLMSYELVSPFCLTLQTLQLGEIDEFREMDSSQLYSTVAFALRHLPSLKVLEGPASISGAVLLLHETVDVERIPYRREFEKLYQKASIHPHKSSPHIRDWNINRYPSFTGTLLLTELFFISLLDADLLRIIGKLCPSLKNVGFCEQYLNGFYEFSPSYNPDREHSPLSVPEELSSILNEWPKVDKITFLGVTPKFVKPILEIFGPKLDQLSFDSCSDINMIDLLLCPSLRVFNITGSSNLSTFEDSSKVAAETFLPHLQVLRSDICLGLWSRLFENKSEMTDVFIHCCHIGTEASTYTWSSLPKMWPLLEGLSINKCNGLTFKILSELIPQLDLLEITLPEMMRVEEPEGMLSYNIMEKCLSRPSPTQITFRWMRLEPMCPYLAEDEIDLSTEVAHMERLRLSELDGNKYVFTEVYSYAHYVPYSDCFPWEDYFDDGFDSDDGF